MVVIDDQTPLGIGISIFLNIKIRKSRKVTLVPVVLFNLSLSIINTSLDD